MADDRTVLCMKWGTLFPPDYVNVLFNACRVRFDNIALEVTSPSFSHLAPARVAGTEKQDLKSLPRHYRLSLFAGNMADTHRGFNCIRKIFSFKPESHINQADENRYLDKRPDNSGKGLPGINAEDGDGHSNCQFKII